MTSFEAAYREHFAFTWRALRRLGVPERDLADSVQDVFLVLYRKFDELDWEGQLTSWLYAVCLRVASDRRRSAMQRHEQLAFEPDSSERSETVPVHDPEKEQLSERRELLEAALDAMSLEQRAVFTLFELEGRTGQEISMILQIPAPTVHSRLRLGREIFRRTVERARAREVSELLRTGGER
ncbi:MAG: sigma-70 family RNA polymerase sigma factor [Myxococcales bacterium]